MDFLLFSLLLIEGADVAILPASFRALEQQLGFTPKILAAIITAQMLTQAVCRPLWGSVADSSLVQRKTVLAVCACGWGVITIALGLSTSWQVMLPLRVMNGVFLSVVHPTLQSIIADTTPPEERGRAFASVSIFEGVGAGVTTYVCTVIAMNVYWGLYGWSLLCIFIGCASVAQGMLVYMCMSEPPRPHEFQGSQRPGISDAFSKLKIYIRAPSFQVVLGQGCFGAIPFSALAFKNMWLQSIGFSPTTVATMMMIGDLGVFPGTLFGGWLGDKLAVWHEFKGRPLAAMTSLGGGAIIVFLLLTVVPKSSAALVTFFLFMLGFQICWCQPACNRPVFAEIVASEHRASIMGWELGLESFCASLLGAPLVGFLAENVFGYIPPKGADTLVIEGNSNALANAMLWIVVIPWLLAVGLYSTLPNALARDKAHVNEKTALMHKEVLA